MKNLEKVKILKTKRAKNKKVECEKFGKVEILKTKRAKNKKGPEWKIWKSRDIELEKGKK